MCLSAEHSVLIKLHFMNPEIHSLKIHLKNLIQR